MEAAAIKQFWQSVIPQWALGEALFTAAHLRLADLIGDGPADIADLAERTGTDARPLARFLNALAAHGVFVRVGDSAYGPSPLSGPLRSDHPETQRPYMALGRIVMHDAWTSIVDTLRTGKSFYHLRFGMDQFEYLRTQPDQAQAFAEGMSVTTRRAEAALMGVDALSGFTMAVDVGGSFGSLLSLLLGINPGATGIVFDRPEIAEAAAARLAKGGGDGRMRAVGGNFFESVPAGGDLYLLKQILHDWPDEECVAILRSVHAAMRDDGRVCLAEMVLPDDASPHPGWIYDLMMMTSTGGRERDAGQYAALLDRAGFTLRRVIRTEAALSVVEAVKR